LTPGYTAIPKNYGKKAKRAPIFSSQFLSLINNAKKKQTINHNEQQVAASYLKKQSNIPTS
jgi:hypothetical protein